MKNILIILVCLFVANSLAAQEDNYDIVYHDHVYYSHLKSVKLTHRGLSTTLPIIDLNTEGSLTLKFDDMEGGGNLYTYEIIHCTKDWQRSDIEKIEYLDGFDNEEIESIAFAAGTIYDYTHYKITIPNEDVRWTISGNYLLVIYEGDDSDRIPVITRRFMVVEPMVGIGGTVESPYSVTKLKTHHRIEIKAFLNEGVTINDPVVELEAVVLQNGRWDNAIFGLAPMFQARDQINWDRTDQVLLPALKEFRNFDIRSFKYTSDFVHSIDLRKNGNDVLLELAGKRTYRNYISDIDANGRFILTNSERSEPDISSDYANVIFSLESGYIFDKEVYVMGAFTDWQLREEFKLEYDEDRKMYLGKALLKQGYYDYMYVTKDRSGFIDCEELEGSWFETENDYTLLLYYSQFGSEYDRLVGSTTINSNKR